jgi:hypothetical protein
MPRGPGFPMRLKGPRIKLSRLRHSSVDLLCFWFHKKSRPKGLCTFKIFSDKTTIPSFTGVLVESLLITTSVSKKSIMLWSGTF